MYFETKTVNVLFSKDENIKEIINFIKMILYVWCIKNMREVEYGSTVFKYYF